MADTIGTGQTGNRKSSGIFGVTQLGNTKIMQINYRKTGDFITVPRN